MKKNKIKNIITDFGQVVVYFKPSYMVGQYVKDSNDAKLLETVVFDRLYWNDLDAGTIENEEVLNCCYKRLPKRLHQVAKEIYYNWIYNIPEIEGMKELLTLLKEKYNVRLILLSNISKYFAFHSHEIQVLKLYDKCYYSSLIGYVKPNVEIFDYVLKDLNIKAEETIFIDDLISNVEGAKKLRINGYLFDGNVIKLKEYLINMLEN